MKRNISGVDYDVISPSFYVRYEPNMRIMFMYNGYGEWVTYINNEPVGLDLTLEAAGDAVAAGLHNYSPPKRAS
ncbi:MAG TPA: hypothetical protein VLJ17_24695 [Xanthobacteraceae bacterium]|nr:hypothetical protein [Xanthobacteraceae bacterium]